MKEKIITFILAGTMILTTASACSESHTAISISDTLSVAQRFLSEMKYEQAIIEFDKILEVEPKNADAYLGKAEAYIALGDTENAIKTLQAGYAQTGDERLKKRIDELTAAAETVAVTTTTTTVATTPSYETMTTTETTTDLTVKAEYFTEIDPELTKTADMILKYIRGEGNLQTDRLEKITGLEIYGTVFVKVDIDVYENGNYMGEKVSSDSALGYGSDGSVYIDDKFVDAEGYLTDISFVEYMPSLTYLSIVCNSVYDISPVSKIKNLFNLTLSYNNIDDISPLKEFERMGTLDIKGNKVSDISTLKKYKKIYTLLLGGNNIPKWDIDELKALFPDCDIRY